MREAGVDRAEAELRAAWTRLQALRGKPAYRISTLAFHDDLVRLVQTAEAMLADLGIHDPQ